MDAGGDIQMTECRQCASKLTIICGIVGWRRHWAGLQIPFPAYFSMAQHFEYRKLGNGDTRIRIETFIVLSSQLGTVLSL
jgi:hypothetical protein